jgi:Tol biopolymer transport system component
VGSLDSDAAGDGRREERNAHARLYGPQRCLEPRAANPRRQKRYCAALVAGGRFVFFLSERDSNPNVFRISVDGGEAERVTDWKGKLAAFEPSPDGKWIAFTAAEGNAGQERAKREKTDFRVVDESPANHALWLTPVDAGLDGKRPVRKLVAGPFHISGAVWPPDSRRIAFETRPSPEADVARRADLQEVYIQSGKVTAIAATPATEAQPRYLRDGRYLAFTRTVESPGRLNGTRIVLLSRDTGKDA